MYCPKCSQQQVSDEVRFCSRCGFSLVAVRELIASSNSVAPVEPAAEAQPGQLSRSQRGVRKGARMMLGSLVVALFIAFLAAIDDDFAVFLLLPFFCFFIGFVRVIYGVFLADKRRRVKEAASQTHGVPVMPVQVGGARSPELSPSWGAPAASFAAQRAETAEMVQPPSVAEGTTRLLDDEADARRR